MSNCIIFNKKNNKIFCFIKDCIIKNDNNFIGSNCKIYGVKLHLFDYVWTDEEINEVYDQNQKCIGFNKNVNEIRIIENKNRVKNRVDHIKYGKAIETKNIIANMSNQQIEDYIESNVTDLNSAKQILKIFGRVILALSRQIDYEIK